MPFRPVAVAVTGVALVAFGVLIGVTVLAPDRPTAAASVPPKAIATSSAEIHRVSVNVSVDETGGASVDPWADVAIGKPCPATEASLGDIGEGTSVVVKDQAGTLLARRAVAGRPEVWAGDLHVPREGARAGDRPLRVHGR